MSRRTRVWWAGWAVGAVATVVVLAWVTVVALDLGRSEAEVRAELEELVDAGDALWRMDSWMALVLAQEAGRAWYEYSPYHEATGTSYTTLLNEIPKGAILTKSPLLTFESALFPLHFELRPGTVPRSPQVPLGNLRDLAQATCVTAPRMAARESALTAAGAYLDYPSLLPRVVEASARAAAQVETQVEAQLPEMAQTESMKSKRDSNLSGRAQSTQNALQKVDWVDGKNANIGLEVVDEYDPDVLVGPLVPLWVSSAGPPNGYELLFLRRVARAGEVLLQGFRADWPELRSALRLRLGEGAAEARLLADRGDDVTGLRLATLPVRLQLPAAAVGDLERGWIETVLLLAWIAVLATILLTGFALRGSVRYAASRSRFASAVTHELRTPLTSFRLYADLLRGAEDEAARERYLDTLDEESARLARLVENVLDYARLEDGRRPEQAGPVAVADLLERCQAALELRCAEAGAALILENHTETNCRLRGEADGVERILSNLIDNACKYGVDAELGGEVRLTVHADDRWVDLRVCDDGPGLTSGQEEAVFRVFDRAGRDSADSRPGIGLGLALARGLADEWGGSLVYEAERADGACFRLRLRRIG